LFFGLNKNTLLNYAPIDSTDHCRSRIFGVSSGTSRAASSLSASCWKLRIGSDVGLKAAMSMSPAV
jgi:hypothetical protein